MEKAILIKTLRDDMRKNRNVWYFKEYIYKGTTIYTKRYNNWFQILDVNGITFALCMTDKVKECIEMFNTCLDYIDSL